MRFELTTLTLASAYRIENIGLPQFLFTNEVKNGHDTTT